MSMALKLQFGDCKKRVLLVSHAAHARDGFVTRPEMLEGYLKGEGYSVTRLVSGATGQSKSYAKILYWILVCFGFRFCQCADLLGLSRIIKRYYPLCIAFSPPVRLVGGCNFCDVKIVEALHGLGLGLRDVKKIVNPPRSAYVAYDEVSKRRFDTLGLDCFLIEDYTLKLLNQKETKLEDVDRPKDVIFFMQHGYDGEVPEDIGICENGVCTHKTIEVLKKLQAVGYLVRVKLHPLHEFRSQRTRVLATLETFRSLGWQLIDGKEAAIQFAHENSIVVTMSSKVVYETFRLAKASVVMCPSLALDGHRSDFFEDLRREKTLVQGWSKSVCEIVERVEQMESEASVCEAERGGVSEDESARLGAYLNKHFSA